MIPIWMYGAAALAIGVGGFIAGARVTNDHWKASMLDVERERAEELREANERNNALAARLETDREGIRVVYREITKKVDRIVDRPVYLSMCLDDDGLRLANAALEGKAVDPGEPDDAVPAPVATGGQDGGRGAAEAGGSGRALPRVLGPP